MALPRLEDLPLKKGQRVLVRVDLDVPLGDVVMVENLRFERGETDNDPAFCVNLAALGDLYVNEAFGASHRAHASIVGPPPLMPHAGGRLLFREVEVLSRLLSDDVARPFV